MTKAVAEGPAQDADRGSRRRARGQGRHGRDGDRRRQPLPAEGGRASRHPRGRQCQGPRRPDRAAGEDARRRGTRRRRGLRWTCWRRARATTAICSRCRSNAPRARCSLGEISDALERAFGRYHTTPEPVQRHLWQARRRALEGGGRGHAGGRQADGPQAAHPGRQDGPGRPRPRRQPGQLGVRRFGLRGDRRAACSRPRARRPSWRSRRTSTWSAPRRSRRATRR